MQSGNLHRGLHYNLIYWRAVAADLIAAGVRPPAREITTVSELETLPGRPVVLDSWGEAWQRIHGNWRHISGRICVADELVLNFGPKFTVLHVPTEVDCPHDSRSGADGRWRCDQCDTDCGPDTYLTPTEEDARG